MGVYRAHSGYSLFRLRNRWRRLDKLLIVIAAGILILGLVKAFGFWPSGLTLEIPEEIMPSVVKPSSSDIANWKVPADHPRYLIIPKLDVFARVKPLGVTSKNQLKSPDNVYDAGWYTGSSKPGENGAALMDGHVSSWTTHGVFYGLKTLAPGDSIIIERGDGRKVNYAVVTTRVYDFKHVDMAAALRPIEPSVSGLNLITCDGQVIAGTNEFNKRLIVFAKQI